MNNAGIAVESEKRDEMNHKGEARLREMLSGQPIQTHWDITQEMTDAQWHRMIGVHLNGTFFCTREALKLMSRPRSDGKTPRGHCQYVERGRVDGSGGGSALRFIIQTSAISL